MIQTNLQEFGIILVIWLGVAVVSVASVICATVLMISSRNLSAKGDMAPSETGRRFGEGQKLSPNT